MCYDEQLYWQAVRREQAARRRTPAPVETAGSTADLDYWTEALLKAAAELDKSPAPDRAAPPTEPRQQPVPAE